MRIIFVCLLLGMACTLFAQRECATHQYVEQVTSNPLYKKNMADVETFIQRQSSINASSRIYNNTIIQIPVVVHVLYNTDAQNISDAQIKSQLDALNRDYRRKNADTVNTPDRFKNVAADVEIEFVLATTDANGRATTGIVRKYTTVANWQMDDKIKFSAQGGDDAWDSKSYLNLWVGSMRSLLGYSSAPGGPAEKDGVVISTNAFGTINTAAPYNLGRTATHEVGHWLGLRHIWGDEACGDDYVDDTPKQGGYTTGCPSGYRTTCNNGPLGDMYMNYMDFTNDACLNLFTQGQKTRMRSLFNDGGVRASLLTSKGLDMPWVEEAPLVKMPVTQTTAATTSFKFYPNPAQNEIVINVDANWVGKELTIVNISGMMMQRVVIAATAQKINISHLNAGVYLLQGKDGNNFIKEKLIKL